MKVSLASDHNPHIEIISESKIKLLAPIIVCIDFAKNDHLCLHIPVGFECDGASMPCGTWSLLNLHPFHPDILVAAIVHDFIYRNKSVMISRADGDLIFRKLCKCNFIKKAILYSSVRLAGGKHYKKR